MSQQEKTMPDSKNEGSHNSLNDSSSATQNNSLREVIESLKNGIFGKISELSEQIEQLKNNLFNAIKQIQVDLMIMEFTNKHNIALKLSTPTGLNNFNEKLNNEECRSDFKVCLTHLIDKDNMEKTVCTIMERFMDKNLIMNCNPERPSKKNKSGLKKTVFCDVLFDLVCENWMGENEEIKNQAYEALKKIIADTKKEKVGQTSISGSNNKDD